MTDDERKRLPGWEHERGSDFLMTVSVLKRVVTAAVFRKIQELRHG